MFETDASKVSEQLGGLDKVLDRIESQAKATVQEADLLGQSFDSFGKEAQKALRELTSFTDEDFDLRTQVASIKALQDEFSVFGTEAEKKSLGESLGLDKEAVEMIGKGDEGLAMLTKRMTEGQTPTAMLGKRFIALQVGLAAVAAAAVVAGAAIKVAISQGNNTDMFGLTANLTGVGVEGLHAYANAAQIAGGSVEGFLGTVRNLTTSLKKVLIDGNQGFQEVMARMGINIFDASNADGLKTTEQLLVSLAEQFHKFDAGTQLSLADMLGIDSGTLLLLKQGPVALREAIAEQERLGEITEKDALIARRFNAEWERTVDIFGQIGRGISNVILPALTSLLEVFRAGWEWIRENQDVLATAFELAFLPLQIVLRLMAGLGPLTKEQMEVVGAVFDSIAMHIQTVIDLLKELFNMAVGEFFEQIDKLSSSIINFVVGTDDDQGAALAGSTGSAGLDDQGNSNNTPLWQRLLGTNTEDIGPAIFSAEENIGKVNEVAAAGASNSIVNSQSASKSVTIGKVEIHAEGANPEEIMQHIMKSGDKHEKAEVVASNSSPRSA